MKKNLLALVALLIAAVFAPKNALAHNAASQLKDGFARSIGVRFGGNFGVSYQHTMSPSTFLEVDAILPGYGSGLVLTAQHNWLMNLPVNDGQLNWYAGIGAGVGVMWSPAFVVGVVPQVGLEYIFENAPVQISVDYAPMLGAQLGKNSGFFHPGLYNFGVSVRYMF